ncbi:OsmC family protein [Bacillus sp. 31A1R]|uniref:OsmC family protein n=1 Tax=Robertmurraya mangrovi TaxID=3098077 RepID=A0ABU5IYT5_9BACI|nr:OsmC family protein [Bacillus sp. 31A1R]MDZ5472276.1 OsmC family protein [Bacillus sp. 31A1R]
MFEFEVKDGVSQLNSSYGTLMVSPDPLKGYKPVELLVSSIVGCSSAILQKVLEKKRIAVKGMTVKVSVERNLEEANRVTKIHLHFVIAGEDISEEQMEKSLEVTLKNCGIIQSVKNGIDINESFEIVDS